MDSQVCKRDTSVNFAGLVGVPFEKYGRSTKTGLDCFGLLRECYVKMGVDVPMETSGRSTAENAVLIAHFTSEVWREVERQDYIAVCFRLGRPVCHIGFTLPNNRFIHTWEGSKGVVIERLSDWEHRIAGYYDYNA